MQRACRRHWWNVLTAKTTSKACWCRRPARQLAFASTKNSTVDGLEQHQITQGLYHVAQTEEKEIWYHHAVCGAKRSWYHLLQSNAQAPRGANPRGKVQRYHGLLVEI